MFVYIRVYVYVYTHTHTHITRFIVEICILPTQFIGRDSSVGTAGQSGDQIPVGAIYIYIHTHTTSSIVEVCILPTQFIGRHSSVGIAGQSGDQIPVGARYSLPSRPTLGSTQPPIQWVSGLSRSKAAGVWRWPPTLSSAEVKERVELYFCSPMGLHGLY